LQENVNRCSAWQSGQRTRAALRSPHEPARDHEGEARAGIAAIKVALDDLPDDRPKIPALILFAPEDCKACPHSLRARGLQSLYFFSKRLSYAVIGYNISRFVVMGSVFKFEFGGEGDNKLKNVKITL